MKKTLPIIVITGPTASGKTTLSLDVAGEIGAEIICADSRIIYKHLDIVSAKPAPEVRRNICHHLIDIKTVNDGIFSAGEFSKLAKNIIRGTKSPIIVSGGTWFYIKSLLDSEDLFEFGQNEALRAELGKLSNETLFNILKEKDPARAEIVHQNNRDKVIRSLELIDALGGKLSEIERPKNTEFQAVWFMKNQDRETLYQEINKRTDKMIELGLYDEFKHVLSLYGENEILYNTIGYREFFDLENGIYPNFETAVEKIKQHTRNFAKRQLTWFRQNTEKFKIKPVKSYEDILKFIN